MTLPKSEQAARLPARILVFYALPAVALAIPTIPVYVQLPGFYATEIGLGLTTVGAVMLVARLCDAVTDPLIGWLVDARPTRLGSRKPWIAAGAMVGGYAMMQLFLPPAGAGALHLLVWASLLYLGWTMVAVPYAAWAADLSPDYHERARITSMREAASLLGILGAGVLLAAGPQVGWSMTRTQASVGWAAILVGAPTIAALLWLVPERHVERRRNEHAMGLLRGLPRNLLFLRLIAAWFLNGLANGVPAALFPLYLAYGLQVGGELQGLLIFAYFASGVAAIPIWLGLSRRIGKHRTWCAAMLVGGAAFVCVPLIGPGQWQPFLIVCLVTGAALGADLAMPPAMQADVVDYDAWRFGRRRAGILFAMWSMASKLALAASVGLAFPALDWFGFDTDGAAGPRGVLALTVIYALVPVVIKVGTIMLVWGHPLDLRRHAAIRARLARRPGP